MALGRLTETHMYCTNCMVDKRTLHFLANVLKGSSSSKLSGIIIHFIYYLCNVLTYTGTTSEPIRRALSVYCGRSTEEFEKEKKTLLDVKDTQKRLRQVTTAATSSRKKKKTTSEFVSVSAQCCV